MIETIILSTKVNTELLPPITPMLAYAVYLSQLVNDIRDMLSKSELMDDSI